MSKLYQALEKAEKDREKGLKRKIYPTSISGRRDIKKPEVEPALIPFLQPNSMAAEQFRKLRTYLLQIKIPEPMKTIMVTSADEGEGKSFVSVHLAAGIATDLHAHALLVECDLRSPVLADWFDLPSRKGLSDYLTEDRKISDLLLKTGLDKLSFLPGGSVPENPTELIGSKKMEALVYELKLRYGDRYIIFDSTPLLATSESEVLSKWVDGIVIVVRAGATPRETVKQALSSMDKEKILGFVLNDVEFRSSGLSSRYFGSDGYYHHYGYGKRKLKGKSRWKIFSRKGSSVASRKAS